VGTEKRERQKANRALKQQEQVKQQRSQSIKRTGIRVALGLVGATAAVVGIAWIGGAFEDDDPETVTEATVAPLPSTPVETTPAVTEPVTSDPAAIDPATSDPATSTPVEPTECPEADGSSEQRREFDAAPPMCIDPELSYTAEVVTNQGEFTIELDPTRAPNTVNNFVVLARYHFFDDTICHRIIPEFVVQCGDPDGTGRGGPGYSFADELPAEGEYEIGSLAMANSGPDTQGSQFFIISGPNGASLPPQYSLFGQVTDGLDTTIPALDALGNPDPAANGVPPLEEVRIESVTITEG
jgi:cyclophilin family peptidyl-prolyl cis-trans isomerase